MRIARALVCLLLAACGTKDQPAAPAPEESLIGGTVSDPKLHGAVWIGNCTATKVGPQVIKTAAHCINRNGETRGFTEDGVKYQGPCEIHPSYSQASYEKLVAARARLVMQQGSEAAAMLARLPQEQFLLIIGLSEEEYVNATMDWAYCKMDKVIPPPYEPVAFDESPVMGSIVELSGFGCPVRNGSVDGKFRIGKATVTRVPSGSNADTVARGTPAILCPGDSGGGAFFVDSKGVRRTWGTNSRTDWMNSYLVTDRVSKPWVAGWAAKVVAAICGLSPVLPGCRGLDQPPPSPTPSPSPSVPPPSPSPSPTATPTPLPETLHGCLEALVSLRLKLTADTKQDGAGELAKLARCNAQTPLPRTADLPLPE